MAKCNTKKHKTYNGALLVAVSKKDGTKFYDIENRGGFITSYIRNVLGIEIPSLYDLRNENPFVYGGDEIPSSIILCKYTNIF
jgi:hypothetical protein